MKTRLYISICHECLGHWSDSHLKTEKTENLETTKRCESAHFTLSLRFGVPHGFQHHDSDGSWPFENVSDEIPISMSTFLSGQLPSPQQMVIFMLSHLSFSLRLLGKSVRQSIFDCIIGFPHQKSPLWSIFSIPLGACPKNDTTTNKPLHIQPQHQTKTPRTKRHPPTIPRFSAGWYISSCISTSSRSGTPPKSETSFSFSRTSKRPCLRTMSCTRP